MAAKRVLAALARLLLPESLYTRLRAALADRPRAGRRRSRSSVLGTDHGAFISAASRSRILSALDQVTARQSAGVILCSQFAGRHLIDVLEERGRRAMVLGPLERGATVVAPPEQLLGLPDHSVEGLLLVNALAAVEEPWIASQELLRVLRPEGWCIALEPADFAIPPDGLRTFTARGLESLFPTLKAVCSEQVDTVHGRLLLFAGVGFAHEDDGPPVAEDPGVPGTPRRSAVEPPRFTGEAACPICGGAEFAELFRHALWGTPVLRCDRCSHSHAPVKQDVVRDQQLKHFHTNKRRAEFYVDYVVGRLDIDSLIDIGVPSDLYLLKYLHNRRPNIEKFAFDLFPLDTPPFVKAVTSFEEIDTIDVALALHVAEHVPGAELSAFANSLASVARWFLVEVPLCSPGSNFRSSSKEPHYQFFNDESLSQLFAPYGARVHKLAGFGPRRGPALIAYRLPDGAAVANGLVTARQLTGR